MRQKLQPSTISVLKAMAPALVERGVEITCRMYEIMLAENPEMIDGMNVSHLKKDKDGKPGVQQRALAAALAAYAQNCDNLDLLQDAIGRIVEKHVSFNVRPEQFPILGNCVLRAIKDVLSNAVTEEVLEEWKNAYWFLANLLIDGGKCQMEANVDKKGGWTGFKTMVVLKKVRESDSVTSFYFGLTDGGQVPDGFVAGQYLTIKAAKEDLSVDAKHDVVRNYSLSCSPGEGYFRCSIKRELGSRPGEEGIVSNYFHNYVEAGSQILVGMPCGKFTLKDDNCPVILVSAGVGVTPMMSMLRSLANNKADSGRKVVFINVAKSPKQHPFKDDIDRMVGKGLDRAIVFYTRDSGKDAALEHTEVRTGRPSRQDLAEAIPGDMMMTSWFYFCGPPGFMADLKKMLDSLGVPHDHQFSENFGPE